MCPDLFYLRLLSMSAWRKYRISAQVLPGAHDSLFSEIWPLSRGASQIFVWTESLQFIPVPGFFFAGGQKLGTTGLWLLM